MPRYLMNAAVIPHGCTGTFTYRLATVEDLVTFVHAGEVTNTVVYPETLAWVRQLTGVTFAVPKAGDQHSPMQPGDEAFVIRRTSRREQDWKQPFDPAVMELGLLHCEPPPAPPLPVKRSARQRIHQARARKRG
jgi:hypothetical protein